MKVEEIFNNKLIDVLNKYSIENNKVGYTLKKAIENSKKKEIIVPVLGMQGMGKSTLINALLQENILPNAADETTCVPVEVKYGEDESALVFFEDKNESLKVFTRKELSEYVDNNYNQANKKGVSKIVLYRKNELLKKGLIIVDLPGVGSLTNANQETTKHYIENLCAAIFVIPTVPTIRKMEALFIKGAWSQFTSAIFVQNDWGESKTEIKDSVEYNTLILKKISEELQNPFDEKIIVVNAYNALKGRLNKDDTLVKSSNIETLYTKIKELSDSWENNKQNNILQRILLCILKTKKVIHKKLDELCKSQEEIEKQRQEEIEKAEKNTENIKEKVVEIKNFLTTKQEELNSKSKKMAQDCTGKIRSQIYMVIDNGVVDGSQLTDAFCHIQEDETSIYFEDIFNVLMNIKFELEEKLEALETVFKLENDFSISSINFSNRTSFKFEKGLEPFIEIGGDVGGIYAGMAVTTALTEAGTVVPGIGNVIGFAVGMGISIVTGIIGHFSKIGITKKRGTEAKKQIAPYIDKIENALRKTTTEKFNSFSNEIKKTLDNIVEERDKETETLKSKVHEKSENTNEQELKQDYSYIESLELDFKGKENE